LIDLVILSDKGGSVAAEGGTRDITQDCEALDAALLLDGAPSELWQLKIAIEEDGIVSIVSQEHMGQGALAALLAGQPAE
tara:strand:- start:29 stop:268 length:240 start_codon:yes stop_codon:yes gene_type:complete